VALTGRLQFIYEQLLPEKAVWDFCCDHGYLGIEALRSKKFSEVHFIDQVPHIVQAIEKLVSEKFSEVREQAHFRISKGEDLEIPVTGTIVIAGVGAFAICKILESLWAKGLLQPDRIVLCPQRDEKKFLLMLESFDPKFSDQYSERKQYVVRERSRERYVYVLTRTH
jgi:tRNA (adenine22-N1)-methyltransferase